MKRSACRRRAWFYRFQCVNTECNWVPLQTLPDCESGNPFVSTLGEVAGFSLHAGVATKANERAKLERLWP
jgi:hypothetical protein